MGALRFAAFARQGRIYLYVYKSVMILWGTSDATITSRRYAMTGRMPMTDRRASKLFIRPLTDYFTGRNEFAYVG